MPIVDIEFQKLLMPLTKEEYEQLEENILSDGVVYEPIVLWNDIIIEGHNRWSIIQKHPEIPYTTITKDFEDREDVIKWMCNKQLGRRNLTEFQKTILLGEIQQSRVRKDAYKSYERDDSGRYIQRYQNENTGRANDIIAEEQNVSVSRVARAAEFLKGVQKAEEVSPNFRERIVSGNLNPSKSDIAKLRYMDGEELEDAVRDIEAGRKLSSCRITKTYQKETFDLADFKEELRGKVIQLDTSLDMTCRLSHPEFLETQDGKDALSDMLLEIIRIVQKYKELT